MNIDLIQVSNALKALSDTDASDLFVNPVSNKPVARPTLAGWRKDAATMPVWAVAKIHQGSALNISAMPSFPKEKWYQNHQNADPGFTEIDHKWAQVDGWGEAKMCIGFPTTGHSTHTKTMFCIMALQALHTKKLSFIPCENNPVGRARNIIATQFLARPDKPQWLLFIDNDMIVPFGSGPWAEEIWKKFGGLPNDFSKMDVCSRLVSHGKQLVGGLYVGRGPNGPAQFAEAYENLGVNRAAHAAPQNKLLATKWVATGAMLVHRDVFLAIAEKNPELKPRHADDVYRFFSMEDDEGEDMLFCQRAREAGIQPYVDLGCHCGHEGNYTFWPHNTTAINPKAGEFLDAKSRIAKQAASVNHAPPPSNGRPDTTPTVHSPDVVQHQRLVSPGFSAGISDLARPMPDTSKPPISQATTQVGQSLPPNAQIPAAMPQPSPQMAMAGAGGPPGLIFGGG